jgi:hypothetical protein
MTIALSTQHFIDHPERSVLDEMNPLGFHSIFLGPGLWPLTLKRIRKKKERPVAGVSLFAERPDFLLWHEEPLRRLPLLTTDKENRQRTIALALRSIHFAAELEVSRLVVPLFSNEALAPRRELLDAARGVIEALIEEAARKNVMLCIPLGEQGEPEENQSIPTRHDLQSWMQEFSGGPLFYWHQAKQIAGAAPPPTKKMRETQEEKRPETGIILATDEMIMTIINPLGKALLPPEVLLAQLGLSGAEDEETRGEAKTAQSLWEPEILGEFMACCGGVSIEPTEREMFVEREAAGLWVIG